MRVLFDPMHECTCKEAPAWSAEYCQKKGHYQALRLRLEFVNHAKAPRGTMVRDDKNPDVSTRLFARPLACLFAPLIRLLSPHCSLRSLARSAAVTRSLACSQAGGKVND